jgi:hypothetical protein
MQELQTTTTIQTHNQLATLAVGDVVAQQKLIQDVIKQVMVPGHHYGHIPGTEPREGEKPRPPVLLKPGAEKLCMVFRLAATFTFTTRELQGGHREERATCTLTHIPSGAVVAQAQGSCSTMEAKYRYRNGKPKCPICGAAQVNKSKHEDGFYCWAKKGGCGATFKRNDERITSQPIGLTENPDIADQFNTVLKMAAKRAHTAATLIATAASDAFVVEEDVEQDDDEPAPQSRTNKRTDKHEAARRATLIDECRKLQGVLEAKPDQIARLLEASGIVAGAWSDMDEATLLRVRALLETKLKEGKPLQ